MCVGQLRAFPLPDVNLTRDLHAELMSYHQVQRAACGVRRAACGVRRAVTSMLHVHLMHKPLQRTASY